MCGPQNLRGKYSRTEKTPELRFADVEVERDYRKDVSKAVYHSVARFKYVTLVITIICLSYEITVGWQGSFFSTLHQLPGFLNPMGLLVTVCLNVALNCVPEKTAEKFTCVVLVMTTVGFLMSNPYRHQRMYPRANFPENLPASDRIWMERCDRDLGESARDSLMVSLALCGNSFFHIFLHVRTRITWMMPACLSLVGACVFLPSLRLDDGGTSFRNFLLLACGSWGHWFGNYLAELQHRKSWALTLQSEESASLESLIGLMFPVVVLVSDGQITPADALEQQFGVRVSSVADLPSQRSGSRQGKSVGLKQLVEEVQVSRLPAKRHLMIRPLGGDRVFECTACAVIAPQNRGILVGFDIRDSWETSVLDLAVDRSPVERSPVGAPRKTPFRHSSSKASAESEVQYANSLDSASDGGAQSDGGESLSLHSASGSPMRRRVSFDGFDDGANSTTASKDVDTDQGSARKKRAKSITVKAFRIRSSSIGTHESAIHNATTGYLRGDVDTTPVDLHLRESSNLACHEARVLLECRHPHVLFMLGYADLPRGTVLVMERCWGAASDALSAGRLAHQCSLSISKQVASALHYLHGRSILHGAVELTNVFLAEPITPESATAKLANFSQARCYVRDDKELTSDIYGLGACTYSLFVRRPPGGAPELFSADQLRKFGFGLLELSIEFEVPEIGLLLQYIFGRRFTSTREVAEKFAHLHASFCRRQMAFPRSPEPRTPQAILLPSPAPTATHTPLPALLEGRARAAPAGAAPGPAFFPLAPESAGGATPRTPRAGDLRASPLPSASIDKQSIECVLVMRSAPGSMELASANVEINEAQASTQSYGGIHDQDSRESATSVYFTMELPTRAWGLAGNTPRADEEPSWPRSEAPSAPPAAQSTCAPTAQCQEADSQGADGLRPCEIEEPQEPEVAPFLECSETCLDALKRESNTTHSTDSGIQQNELSTSHSDTQADSTPRTPRRQI